jgi:hypothetical protein
LEPGPAFGVIAVLRTNAARLEPTSHQDGEGTS